MRDVRSLVSIITPSFNQVKYLEETIHSILDQDYANLEYIIIDGGSTDGSVELIRRYAPRLAYWVSEKDHGQTHALNKGFRRARGDILGWLNSDDRLEPGAIRGAADFFATHPEVDVVYGDRKTLEASGHVKEIVRSFEFGLDTNLWYCIPQEATFFRRRLLTEAGYLDPSLHFTMDYDLWLRAVVAGFRFEHVPGVWGNFRHHRTSKTRSLRGAFWQERVQAIERHLTPDAPISAERQEETRQHVYFFAALECACSEQSDIAHRYFERAFQNEPFVFSPVRMGTEAVNTIMDALIGSPKQTDPRTVLDFFLDHVPPKQRDGVARTINSLERKEIAHWHIANAFYHYDHNEWDQVQRHVVRGVTGDPTWLRNRGVWSLAVKTFFGHRVQSLKGRE